MIPFSDMSLQLQQRLQSFMEQHVYPAETVYAEQLSQAQNRFAPLPLMEELKAKAKAAGLWNLFVPKDQAHYSDHG